MKRLLLLYPLVFAMCATCLRASENSLGTVYQPLDPMVDRSVEVREVPFVTGGAFPEVWFNSITKPHIPQQSTPSAVGDINVASRAKVKLSCESAAAGQTKLYIIWDFSKADPKQVNEDLVKALIECLEKTAGQSIVLYSKFVGFEKYPQFQKLVEARFPQQTPEQLKEDSGGKNYRGQR